MASKVLAGLIYRIFELYIDDVLIHGTTESEFLINLRKVFERLREHNVAANPKNCLLYTSPSPRDGLLSRMPSSA